MDLSVSFLFDPSPGLFNVCFRLILSALCGCLVGIERARRDRGAGIRTHTVVSLASCLTMIVSKYGFYDVLNQALHDGLKFSLDPSRIAAGTVTALGFLGAGLIVINRRSVYGLTTAAGIWATVGIGICIGSGLVFVGIFATGLLIASLLILSRFLQERRRAEFRFCGLADVDAINQTLRLLESQNLSLQGYAIKREAETGYQIDCAVLLPRDARYLSNVHLIFDLPHLSRVILD